MNVFEEDNFKKIRFELVKDVLLFTLAVTCRTNKHTMQREFQFKLDEVYIDSTFAFWMLSQLPLFS